MKLGTAGAAVRSCVNLFARLFETPEEYVAYYLDMYYQLRLRWEEEREVDGGRFVNRPYGEEAAEDVVGAVHERPADAVQDSEAARGTSPSPTETSEDDPPPAAPVDTSSGLRPPSPQGEGPKPAIAKKPRPGSRGNDYAAKAAVFKREVRERMLEMRKRGLTTPLIVKKGNSNITEQQIADILAAKPVPVAVYRVLEAVLDMIEKDNVLPAASAE